jgi:twitching motility protein PilU
MDQKKASDLFITAGRAPSIKVDNLIIETSKIPLTADQALEIVSSIMNQKQKDEFESTKECQFAIGIPDFGRFRVSVFTQRDCAGMVMRRIANEIPDAESLHLPIILKEMIMEKRGLILFVGATGTGKSTSLAALIKHRNQNSNGHIIRSNRVSTSTLRLYYHSTRSRH